jgi:hypothetical protein
MSPTDIQKVAADARLSVEQGYTSKEETNTQSVMLLVDNQELPVGISFHGGGANDHVFNKNDYNVKIKGNQAAAGYTSFNLFNPSVHSWTVPLLSRRVADSLDLITNDQFPVIIKINNKTSGVYLLEEKVNEDFLAKRNFSGAQVIKLRDETRLPHRVNTVALDAHILSGLDWEIANVDPLKDDTGTTLAQLNRFYKAVKVQDFASLSPLIDLDYWARFDAYRQVLGIDHDVTGANFIMVYLPEQAKFYPVARSEGGLNQLVIEGGSSLRSYNNYDPHLAAQYNYPRLFLFLNRQPEFRLLKYRYLNQLLGEADKLRQEFKNVYDQIGPAFAYDTSDEASVWQKKKLFNGYLDTIDYNLKIVKQELTFAQVAINVINQSGWAIVEIIPDSLMPIDFESVTFELANGLRLDTTSIIKQKMILADYDQDFDVVPTTFIFNITVPSPVKSIQVQAINQITGVTIDAIYSGVASN